MNGSIQAPLWSYKLGLDNGWMPTDPRKSQGKCAALSVTVSKPYNGNYLPWQTGGQGAGDIPQTAIASYPWPPVTVSNALAPPSLLPQYTPTGSVTTLPPPTLTPTSGTLNGWYDRSDTTPAPTPISGCAYPNAWAAPYDLPLPVAGCSTGA